VKNESDNGSDEEEVDETEDKEDLDPEEKEILQ